MNEAALENAIRLAGTVGAVCAVAWACGRVARAKRTRVESPVRVVMRMPVTKGLQMIAVKVGDRGVLLAISGTTVTNLADLTAAEVAALEPATARAGRSAAPPAADGPPALVAGRKMGEWVRVARDRHEQVALPRAAGDSFEGAFAGPGTGLLSRMQRATLRSARPSRARLR